MAPIKINYQWGYINKSGEVVIKPRFDNVQGFSRGLAKVLTNSCISSETAQPEKDDHDPKWRWSYIDKTGKVVWTEDADFVPTEYKYTDYINEAGDKYIGKSDKLALCREGFDHNYSVVRELLSLTDSDISKMTVARTV
jgi:hypothetical protein